LLNCCSFVSTFSVGELKILNKNWLAQLGKVSKLRNISILVKLSWGSAETITKLFNFFVFSCTVKQLNPTVATFGIRIQLIV